MPYSNRSVSCSITREQLHRLVWSEPMTKLAEKLDLSGRGLAKMCERHRVPRPGRGYWQKKQHGHSVEPTVDNVVNHQQRTKASTVSLPSKSRRLSYPKIMGSVRGNISAPNSRPCCLFGGNNNVKGLSAVTVSVIFAQPFLVI